MMKKQSNLSFESRRIHKNKYQETISGLVDIYGEIYMSEIEIKEAVPDDADILIAYTKRIVGKGILTKYAR